METNKVVLHGGGEHGRVVASCLLDEGREIVGMFDPKFEGDWHGVKFLGAYKPELFRDVPIILSIGDNRKRQELAALTPHRFSNTVHPTAYLSRFATLGAGNMLLQGIIVQQGAVLGDHVILNTGCRIDHDCVIGNYVHVAPGAVLGGNVRVGEGTFVGAGATLIHGIKVGAWVTIGAGAVVIRDVEDGDVVVGNPSKIIGHNRI